MLSLTLIVLPPNAFSNPNRSPSQCFQCTKYTSQPWLELCSRHSDTQLRVLQGLQRHEACYRIRISSPCFTFTYQWLLISMFGQIRKDLTVAGTVREHHLSFAQTRLVGYVPQVRDMQRSGVV